mmetsp:Transcript_27346/g.77998  ORF Transcript_27346/g.77998 Transcript_27346/m.77998 type:complete len:208 (-) Transcript_27346:3838-4461(-)
MLRERVADQDPPRRHPHERPAGRVRRLLQEVQGALEGGGQPGGPRERVAAQGGDTLRDLQEGVLHRPLERRLRGVPVHGAPDGHQVGDEVHELALHAARAGRGRPRGVAGGAHHGPHRDLHRNADAHGRRQLHVHHAERPDIHSDRRCPDAGRVREGAAAARRPGGRRARSLQRGPSARQQVRREAAEPEEQDGRAEGGQRVRREQA